MTIDKYSTDIIKFIDTNFKNLDIDYGYINQLDIVTSITKIIQATDNYNNDYKYNEVKLLKIHHHDQYPLLFLLFCKLYEHNKLGNNSFTDINEQCDFQKFIQWYNVNHHLIRHEYFEKLVNSEADDDLNQLYKLIFLSGGPRFDLHQLLYINKFVSLDVQQNAEIRNIIKRTYDNQEFKLIIHFPINDNGDSTIDMNKIFHIIKFMNSLGALNNSFRKPNINIFMGEVKKRIPSPTRSSLLNSTHILTAKNVNSGSSLIGIDVMIWRAEELYKVLIHELIHFHGFDYHDNGKLHDPAGAISRFITEKYNIEWFDKTNESFTETLAVLIHSIFITYYHPDQKLSDILRSEMVFTLFQISKIFKFYHINSIKELGVKPISQTTSVFSYFFIKGALLFSLPDFVKFINVDNLCIKNKIKDFGFLVKTVISNNKFLTMIDDVLKTPVTPDENEFIMNTLRMTCNQL